MDETERTYKIRVGELTGTLVMPADVPVREIEFGVDVEDEDTLRQVVQRLGGIGRFLNPENADRLLTIYKAKDEGSDLRVDVHVWLEGDLASPPAPRTPPAVRRMLDEHIEERRGDEALAARLAGRHEQEGGLYERLADGRGDG